MAQDAKSRRDDIINETLNALETVIEALRGKIGTDATWASVGDAASYQASAREMADRLLLRGEYSQP